jgi:hypothetical protein
MDDRLGNQLERLDEYLQPSDEFLLRREPETPPLYRSQTDVAKPPRRPRALALVALVSVMSIAALVISRLQQTPPAATTAISPAAVGPTHLPISSPSNPQIKTVTSGGQLCAGGGTTTSLAALDSAKLPFDLWLPNSQEANASSVTQVLRCSDNAVAMRFASGLSVVEDTNAFPDPKATWEQLAAQDPSYTSVANVHDAPALLIDPSKSPVPIQGSVTLILGGTRVVVIGDGKAAISTLEDVASSLYPS